MQNRAENLTENRSTALYDYPAYYELAFSFRDIPREVTCFEQLFTKYAKLPVVRVLELAVAQARTLKHCANEAMSITG